MSFHVKFNHKYLILIFLHMNDIFAVLFACEPIYIQKLEGLVFTRFPMSHILIWIVPIEQGYTR
ncbi:MAG: hypothetical protein EAZ89_04660 [Bacteroidetes bacterium]|nr:MAG: hypothetical protein EAZ89_04660 [Bacteroidota bacterium]